MILLDSVTRLGRAYNTVVPSSGKVLTGGVWNFSIVGVICIGRTPHVPVESVIAEWRRFNGATVSARVVLHNGWEAEFHDGPAPVVLVRVLGMGHQIAGGRDDRLPRQATRSEPDAVAMALVFFVQH